jgi:hypothetical protein
MPPSAQSHAWGPTALTTLQPWPSPSRRLARRAYKVEFRRGDRPMAAVVIYVFAASRPDDQRRHGVHIECRRMVRAKPDSPPGSASWADATAFELSALSSPTRTEADATAQRIAAFLHAGDRQAMETIDAALLPEALAWDGDPYPLPRSGHNTPQHRRRSK